MWECRECGWKDEKCGNAGNQVANSSIVVETTQTSNGNDKFKEWGEAKIIENEPICKSLVSHI